MATWCEEPTLSKNSDAGKDWRQKEKGAAEDEVDRQHHWLNGHELEQLWEILKHSVAGGAAVHGVTKFGHDLVSEQQRKSV